MRIMALTAAAVALLGLAGLAQAQSGYPSRPVTLIVASAPGGTTDFTARLLADPPTKALKQSVLVDNRGGGSGNIGTALAAKARPDGHTLLVQYSGYHVANPSMFKELPWSPTRDFTSIGMALV